MTLKVDPSSSRDKSQSPKEFFSGANLTLAQTKYWPYVQKKFIEFKLSVPENWIEGQQYVEALRLHSIYIQEFAFLFVKAESIHTRLLNFLMIRSLIFPAWTVRILYDTFCLHPQNMDVSDLTAKRMMHRICNNMVRIGLIRAVPVIDIQVRGMRKFNIFMTHWAEKADYDVVHLEYEFISQSIGFQVETEKKPKTIPPIYYNGCQNPKCGRSFKEPQLAPLCRPCEEKRTECHSCDDSPCSCKAVFLE